MKSSIISSPAARSGSVGIRLTILSVALSGGFAVAQPTPGKTKAPEKTSGKTPTASQTPTASPKALPTRPTEIDAKLEAELLQAEDRFVIAIQNHDAKALEELLQAYYADSFDGEERAINKRGVIARANARRLPAYRVEKERTLIRSGDTFTVEGLARDTAREVSDERPNEWVHVRRIWERRGDRWIATAQIIKPAEEPEAEKEKHGPEEKDKEPK
jgi:hypothetical protein